MSSKLFFNYVLAGPIVTSVSSQIVREELNKVKIVDDENVEEASEAPAKKPTETIEESMYKSALENPNLVAEESCRAESEDRQSIHSDNTTIFDREDHYGDELDDDYSGPQWVWLTMGACKLDPSHLPASWFVENISSQQSLSGEAWRMNILQVIL